jgi:hypothetical protein
MARSLLLLTGVTQCKLIDHDCQERSREEPIWVKVARQSGLNSSSTTGW